MPALEDIDGAEPALLWERRREDGAGEAVVAAAPECLPVRWVETTRFVPGETGEMIQVDAMVSPPRAVPMGSLFYRGDLTDWQAAGAAGTRELYKSVTRKSARDLKGRWARWEYGLTFYRGSLPDTAEP